MFHGYNVAEYRARARSILPRGLFEFIDRGTEDEINLKRNRDDLDALRLHKRILKDVSKRDISTTLFGKKLAMPLIVAPTGAAGLAWHNGELAVARAASDAGIPFSLATGSLTAMERIREAAKGTLWFQLYVNPDREIVIGQLKRVLDAGFDALVVTVDQPVPANREYNMRSGFSVPFRLRPSNIVDVLTHPRWLVSVLGRYLVTTGLPRYENFPTPKKQLFTGAPLGRALARSDSLTWTDFDQLRTLWPKTMLVKGILHPDDAELAIAHGADAIVVSNHGGRALDSALSPVEALPAIVERVAGRVPVLADSGVRRGSDVVKLLALGADCVLIGRPTLYGAAAAGEAGARRVLEIFAEEIGRTLAMMGLTSIEEVTAEYLVP